MTHAYGPVRSRVTLENWRSVGLFLAVTTPPDRESDITVYLGAMPTMDEVARLGGGPYRTWNNGTTEITIPFVGHMPDLCKEATRIASYPLSAAGYTSAMKRIEDILRGPDPADHERPIGLFPAFVQEGVIELYEGRLPTQGEVLTHQEGIVCGEVVPQFAFLPLVCRGAKRVAVCPHNEDGDRQVACVLHGGRAPSPPYGADSDAFLREVWPENYATPAAPPPPGPRPVGYYTALFAPSDISEADPHIQALQGPLPNLGERGDATYSTDRTVHAPWFHLLPKEVRYGAANLTPQARRYPNTPAGAELAEQELAELTARADPAYRVGLWVQSSTDFHAVIHASGCVVRRYFACPEGAAQARAFAERCIEDKVSREDALAMGADLNETAWEDFADRALAEVEAIRASADDLFTEWTQWAADLLQTSMVGAVRAPQLAERHDHAVAALATLKTTTRALTPTTGRPVRGHDDLRREIVRTVQVLHCYQHMIGLASDAWAKAAPSAL